MENNADNISIRNLANKSELDRVLSAGLHGDPELKREEKLHYLGEFRERVIKLLSKKQVMEPAIYPEIASALMDKRAVMMLIDGDIDLRFTDKYLKLAKKLGKKASITSDPEFKGDTGLVIVSNDAADSVDIMVPDRETRLKKLGIPAELISSARKKVCEKCFNRITKADPGESINYQTITLADRFWGDHCTSCKVH